MKFWPYWKVCYGVREYFCLFVVGGGCDALFSLNAIHGDDVILKILMQILEKDCFNGWRIDGAQCKSKRRYENTSGFCG